MGYRHLFTLPLLGYIAVAQAQYGCGTASTPPCQIMIQPQQNNAQQMMDIGRSIDPGAAFRQGMSSSQRYDLQEQELQLRRQEIELRRLEIEKRKRQLQQ